MLSCNSFPGWMEVLHPAQSATSAGQTPLSLGELRWRCHSWNVGARRALCIKEQKSADKLHRKNWTATSSPGSPKPMPKTTPTPRLQGSYSLPEEGFVLASSHWNNPLETRWPDIIAGTHSDHMMYATHLVWDEATGVTYMDTVTCLSGESGPQEHPAWQQPSQGLQWRNWQKKIWQKADPECVAHHRPPLRNKADGCLETK